MRNRLKLSVFKAILGRDRATLIHFSQNADNTNTSLSILCLDHIFSSSFCLPDITVDDLAGRLRLFLKYCHGLQRLLRMVTTPEDIIMQRLLAFSSIPGSGHLYLVQPQSILYPALRPEDISNDTNRLEGIVVSKGKLHWTIGLVLRSQLQQRVATQNLSCRAIQVFKICDQFSVEGWCRFTNLGGCREVHLSSCDSRQYRQLLEVLLLQIQIYHTINGVEAYPEHQEQRRSV